MIYVLDTNVISALLKGNEWIKNKAQQVVLQGDETGTNAISYYEIKRGLLAINARRQL